MLVEITPGESNHHKLYNMKRKKIDSGKGFNFRQKIRHEFQPKSNSKNKRKKK